jgi:hypothetical protein
VYFSLSMLTASVAAARFFLLSSGIAWDESYHSGISIAKGTLYEVCQLGAKGLPSKSKQKETKGQAAISCTDRKQTDGMEQWGKQQSAVVDRTIDPPGTRVSLSEVARAQNFIIFAQHVDSSVRSISL